MNINKSERKVTECSRMESVDAEGIRLENEALKTLDEFRYMGRKLPYDAEVEDIKCSLPMAKNKVIYEEEKFVDIEYRLKC